MDKKAVSEMIESFRVETNAMLDDYSKEPVTKGELAEMSRLRYYVLSEIEKSL